VLRPELLVALREATPAAPSSLYERVHSLAVAASPPARRRPGWRVSLALLAAAVASAALAGALLLPGGGAPTTVGVPGHGSAPVLPGLGKASPALGRSNTLAPSIASSAAALPGPSATRAQRYGATLRLRLRDGSAVAAAAREAVRIAQSLGGYPETVKVSVGAKTGTATVVLRIPRARVGAAIDRLSALGRVVGEQASISDLQTGVDQSGRRIVRLERELAAALHAPQSVATRRLAAALAAQIEGLQRARAATLRSASDATVTMQLSTPAPTPVHPRKRVSHRGPFHELGVAFRLVGIGLVYAFALGTPLAALAFIGWLAASRLRRRRVERLLSRS